MGGKGREKKRREKEQKKEGTEKGQTEREKLLFYNLTTGGKELMEGIFKQIIDYLGPHRYALDGNYRSVPPFLHIIPGSLTQRQTLLHEISVATT